MTSLKRKITLLTLLIGSFSWSLGAIAEEPKVGKAAAAKYFGAPAQSSEGSGSAAPYSSGDHYLMLGFTKYLSSTAWKWGQDESQDSVGDYGLALTYRMDEWRGSTDLHLRVNWDEYKATVDKRQSKLSFLGMVTFPDATSRFPLYFGGGVGGGVFFTQIEKESALTLEYQLVLGARFFDVFNNAGFFVESGIKNHLQFTSDGQFNSTFLTAGAVFTF